MPLNGFAEQQRFLQSSAASSLYSAASTEVEPAEQVSTKLQYCYRSYCYRYCEYGGGAGGAGKCK